jgi:hypothetical protein
MVASEEEVPQVLSTDCLKQRLMSPIAAAAATAAAAAAACFQVDMLDSEEEVSQVLSFVSSNASKLLQLDAPAVLPISGRAALKAKLGCGSGQSGGVLDSWEDELLTSQPGWQQSRWGLGFWIQG